MSRTDKMRSLVDQLLDDRTARHAAVATMRTDTRQFLHTVQGSHTAMAKTQAQRATVQRRQIATNRRQMAKAVATLRTQNQAARHATVQALNTQLTTDHTELAATTVAFLRDVQQAQAAMSKAQTEQLAAGHASVRAATAQLVEEATAFIHSVQADHANMAQTQAKRLASERMALAATTTQLRKQAADFLSAIQADTAQAAATWQLLFNQPAPTPATGSEPISMATDMSASGDPLRNLRGIGVTTEERLYAAGITTYAQLADATPEAIRAAIGATGVRRINPEEWIEQAKQMLGGN